MTLLRPVETIWQMITGSQQFIWKRAGGARLVGLVVVQSLDKNVLISSSHGRDQKELKKRERLGE